MPRRTGQDTKQEILRAAATLFRTHGYRGASLADIARAVGYSKASVLYHFPTKEVLLRTLIKPAIDDFEALLDRLTPLPPAQARQAVAVGLADLTFTHGDTAAVLNAIGPALSSDPALEFLDHEHLHNRFLRLVAGPNPDPGAEVAIEVALAGGLAARVEYAHLPDDQLHAALVTVLTRVLDLPGSASPAPPGPASPAPPGPASPAPPGPA
jgi:AcrR family transcriptional regulator